MKSFANRISAVFCASAAALFLSFSLTDYVNIVSAEEPTGSLSVWCVQDDQIFTGMHWQIYRVGHRSADDYIFEGNFADYRPTLGDESAPMTEWNTETLADAAQTLKIYTIADMIPPIKDGVTNERGCVTFDGLSDGLYLVWGDNLLQDDTTYIASSVFFEMSDGKTAELSLFPKLISRALSESIMRYSVRKIWENDENQLEKRSTSIIIERYRDHQYYDEIMLNDANNWTFEWDEADGHEWLVKEKVIPDSYTVAYKEHFTQFLVVNTYEEHESAQTALPPDQTTTAPPPGTTTTVSVPPADTTTTTASVPPAGTTAVSASGTTVWTTVVTVVSTEKAEEKAPQTGQLWWPVFPLGGTGLLLLALGFYLKKEDDAAHKDKDQ